MRAKTDAPLPAGQRVRYRASTAQVPHSCVTSPRPFILCAATSGLLAGFSERAAAQELEFLAPVNILAVSVAYQAPLSLDKDLPLGGGLFYTREYFVTRRTALGIHAGLRFFPDTPRHLAFGYGLSIKHYLGPTSSERETTGFYLLYGLQLQMNVLEGRSGTATDHDTRMSAGYDWGDGRVKPLVEVGYHLTQLRNFDEETLWWPYAELAFGIRF